MDWFLDCKMLTYSWVNMVLKICLTILIHILSKMSAWQVCLWCTCPAKFWLTRKNSRIIESGDEIACNLNGHIWFYMLLHWPQHQSEIMYFDLVYCPGMLFALWGCNNYAGWPNYAIVSGKIPHGQRCGGAKTISLQTKTACYSLFESFFQRESDQNTRVPCTLYNIWCNLFLHYSSSGQPSWLFCYLDNFFVF